MTEYYDRHTMERMREHSVRAEGTEMDLIRAVAAARVAVGNALEVVRVRIEQSNLG